VAKRFTAIMLFVFMLLPSLSFTATASEKEIKTPFVSRLQFEYNDGEILRAIVVFDGESDIALNQKGTSLTVKTAKRLSAANRAGLTKAITEGYSAKLAFSYGALINGIAVDAAYGQLKEIEKLDGVARVYIANRYSAPVAETGLSPSSVSAGRTLGFTGATDGGSGTVIAVLDTGLNVNHSAFSDAYISANTALDQSKVNSLRAGKGLLGVYQSKEIPYIYDYADEDTDVYSSDSHGNAVASIAAGNNGSDFKGIAPDAQILGMKIFADSGYTDSSVYFAAMEDAYILGADVINLSLGSQNGFSFDYELETELYGDIFSRLREAGVFVCCAAGNEYSQGYRGYAYNKYSSKYYADGVTADYADYGVIGNPASYRGAIAVASGDNSSYSAYTISVGGKEIEYADGTDGSFVYHLGGQSLPYIMIPSVGAPEDYAGLDVNGKVAVVSRGEITFEEKCNAAAAAGAVAMICYNNQSGIVYMEIENPAIPCVSVASTAYELLSANSLLTVNTEPSSIHSPYGVQVSDFSSWGVTPDLKLKPEITGIGGNVRCASNSPYGYQTLSGTSMATPVVSGIFACAKSFVKSTHPEYSNPQLYELVYDSVLSSAELLYNGEGLPYSPRQQGAGMPLFENFAAAVAAFENPIANVGHDPEKTGVYTFETRLKNLYGKSFSFSVGASYILCDAYTEDEGVLYNRLTPYALDADISVTLGEGSLKDGVYTVGADSDYVDITFTVSLSEEAKEYLSAYPNGGYVEGYIFLSLNGGTSHIKQSFMGFYGDWTAAPVFETYDWGEVLDTKLELKNNGEEEPDYTTVLNTNVGYNEAYLYNGSEVIGFIGDNLYGWVSYDYDRMAFPTAEKTDGCLANSFIIYPSLLRNVRHIIMTVSDADTGKVYYVDDTEYAMKNFFDLDTYSFMQGTYFAWDGFYYTGYGFAYVPDGTRIKVSFETQLDFEGAELITEREYYMYIDNTAPKFDYSWDKANKLLTVSAMDERYISNIFVYDEGGENVINRVDITDSVPGVYGRWTVDLSDAVTDSDTYVYLELQDYASNYEKILVDLSIDDGPSSPPSEGDHLKGDLNLDRTVDSLDAAYALKYDVGFISALSEVQFKNGDINSDGKVDNLDAALILKYDAFDVWYA